MAKKKLDRASRKRLDKWLASANPYDARGYYVHQLGYESYGQYLASPLWAKIRAKVLGQSRLCAFCLSPATEVHHASYRPAVINGQDLSDLYPVCRTCHFYGEFDESGDKTTPEVATKRMYARARENRVWVKRTVTPPSPKQSRRETARLLEAQAAALDEEFCAIARYA